MNHVTSLHIETYYRILVPCNVNPTILGAVRIVYFSGYCSLYLCTAYAK